MPRAARSPATGDLEPAVEVPGFELTVDEERIPPPVRENSFRPFTPAYIGAHLERFQALAMRIAALEPAEARRELEVEIAWADNLESGFEAELRPRSLRKYRAALSVLADLISQDWVFRFRDHQLELAPPDFTEAPRTPEDVSRQKASIRRSMRAERLAQLQPESVRRFLQEMEERRSRAGKKACSVLDLVADGEELARQLREAQRPTSGYEQRMLDIVQPYIQLASEEACAETGFRLLDIWRYFRYFWSLPYFSTPGRNLFYLVRDGSRPFHPVIGIAALGNSIVRLADRDRWIGWDLASLEERLKATPEASREALAAELFDHLREVIETAIASLDPTGIVASAELKNPTAQTVQRLAHLARDSAQKRRDFLKQHEAHTRSGESNARPQKRARPLGPSQMLLAAPAARTLADLSVEELFKQKRAAQYSDLLRAKLTFASVMEQSVEPMLLSEDGRRALSIAIKNIKQDHIGSSVMDIIICGAIPPYSYLLGGKLVCMLLTSPQIRLDYRERYESMPSEIASKMRGAQHAKPADLVFLGTTSLYHVGSSQYNRVRVPASLSGASGEIRYERLGETRGYGSVHFSERTRSLLEEVLRDDQGATFITRTFGEGVNPKLRLVRDGLNAIGINQDHFLRHQCRRIIYGVPLAKNTPEYLRNEKTSPEFILPAKTREEAERCTRDIAAYWVRRWMAPRARNLDVLGRVAATTRQELLISASASAGEREASEFAPVTDEATRNMAGNGGGRKPPPSAGEIGVRFIQQLYNHRSCYADRLTGAQLAAIHVETPLESFIIDRLRSGKDVILTGNPGDGKTHLIMKLQTALKALGAEHHADATAEESYDVLLDIWRKARKRKKPFCLAINEWPLLEFVRAHGESFPPLLEVRKQIENGIVYGPSVDAQTVVVVDLNNRNLVSLDVFKRLLTTLTDNRFYPECKLCPAQRTCDVPRARSALEQPRIRERLFRVLELVTKRGHHVTMRDLQGFVAYLLTGGRSCEQLVAPENEKNPRPYFNLAFEGESALFDAIREVFDPARVTHPIYDDALWAGSLPISGWTPLGPPSPPPSKAPSDQIDAMRAAKRRFFFEHEDGERLVQFLPQDERKFYDALSAAPEHDQRVVRELLRLINRFFDARDEDDSVLRLWSRHRYDARWSPTYVSVRAVPADAFKLEVPRLPTFTAAAFSYQPDHVVLAAYRGKDRVASLTVDLGLYRTLFDAQRGLPMALRSPEVLKRIDVFFNELARAFRAQREIEDVHIKNFETGEDLKFKVDRRHKRFAL